MERDREGDRGRERGRSATIKYYHGEKKILNKFNLLPSLKFNLNLP